MKSGWMVWGQARVRTGLWAIAAIAVLLAPCARADDAGQTQRAVRLSNVDGIVQVSQGGQRLTDSALANMPLFEGTQLTTLDDGRAEIQFEDGSVARISPNSSLTLRVLRGQDGGAETELVLGSGLGYFELQGGAGQTRIRFGDAVVSASGFTVLRVNLDNPPGELAVFSGNAHLERGSAMTLDLHGGESVALDGTNLSRYNLQETIQPDSWDSWNADRDQALQAAFGAQTGATKSFPDSSNPAWADLDANGNWYNVPGQGYVWSPTEASSPEWDPYGNGSWMWNQGFGYYWVSGNPWGYMPYQCGSWNFFDEFGWGWAPGSMCRPWWGLGGWGYNIGYGPIGYRPPRRPNPGPLRPRGLGGDQLSLGTKPVLHPVVTVNRHMTGVTGELPARDRSVPVVIAGHSVRAVAPVSARPAYSNGFNSGNSNRTQPAYGVGSRPVGGVIQPSGSIHPPSRPALPGGTAPRTVPAPAPSHSSGGGGSSSRPAVSSGGSSGGGGGGGHSSGGGGGGGGGGHH